MVCFEDGNQKVVKYTDLFKTNDKRIICFLSLDEFMHIKDEGDVKQKIMGEFQNHNNVNSKFEHHDTFDLIYLSIPRQLARVENVNSLSIFLSSNLLLIVYVPWNEYDDFEEVIVRHINETHSLGANLVFLLDLFTKEDSHILQDIEKKITDLEDDLMVSYNNEYIKNIINYRKDLLALKRYYEQMVDLFDELNENDSLFLNEFELKHFRNVSNRINRLYHTVLNLRDYVTQVREAYQSQADINLNTIMKVFTVLTAIFLPLTLIVGWYGMNLKMPEYNLEYGYPIIILVNVLVVALCIFLFKKNKWF